MGCIIMIRRHHFRTASNLPGKISFDNIKEAACLVVDLSHGGTKFATSLSLEKDKDIVVDISLLNKKASLPGKVIWTKPHPANKDLYIAGIRFNGLNVELKDFLHKAISNLSQMQMI